MKNIYQRFLHSVLKANKKIAQLIIQNTDTLKESNDAIGFGGDLQKNIDREAEKIFIHYLLPFGEILSEESGHIKGSLAQIEGALIIIDPLDGSDNFVSNLPYYGTSVSLQIKGETVVGVVFNLVTGECIYKTPFETNIPKRRTEPLFGVFERAYRAPEVLIELKEFGYKVRSPGATALSLANIHQYHFFLLCGSPRLFDIDAALYIANDHHIYQNEDFLLVCYDQKLFDRLRELIQ